MNLTKFKLGKWYYGRKPTGKGSITSSNSSLVWTPEMDKYEGIAFQCVQIFNAGSSAFLSDGFKSYGLYIYWAAGPFKTKNEARTDYLRTKIKIRKRVKLNHPRRDLIEADIIEAASNELRNELDKEIVKGLCGPSNSLPVANDKEVTSWLNGMGAIEENLRAVPVTHEDNVVGSAVIKKSKKGATATIKVHTKLWRDVMRKHVNKYSGYQDLTATLRGKRAKNRLRKKASDEKWVVAIRAGENRIEELPSGKTVFYINVGAMPSDEVEAYLKKIRKSLDKKANPLTDHGDTFKAAIKQDKTLAQDIKALDKDYDARIKKMWSEHDKRVSAKKAKKHRLNKLPTSKPKSKWRAAAGITSVVAIVGSMAHLWPYLILLV